MTTKFGPINPYLAGPPITSEFGFYGRHDFIDEMVNILTNTRQNAVVLHGQRRIGKSSLLHRLRRDEKLQQEYLPIFFDMQLYEGFTPARTLAKLAQIIIDQINIDLSFSAEADLSADFHRFERVFLPEVYRELDHKRLLILFDEFDVAVPPDMAGSISADTLLGYLRTLIAEEQERLAFIFVVGQRLDLLNEGYRRLFKGANAKSVGRLGQQDTYELLTGLGEKGQINYTNEALVEIWALTNGHPYLTQLIGFEIFGRLQKKDTRMVTMVDVTACLDKAMETGQGGLDWFWDGFNREEQLVLMAVADLTDREKSVTDAEIDNSLQQHLLFLTDADRRDAYNQLIEGDFLIDTGRRRYQFAVEFIRRWIVKHHSLKEAQREIEQSSPEALNYYQLGRIAFENGKPVEAIENYRLALEHNPRFAEAQLHLAAALRTQDEIKEAIEACERAYQLDPSGARERLIEFRLDYARQLERSDDNEAMLAQVQRVLEIDPDHSGARQLTGTIYLERISSCLKKNNLTEALDHLQNLVHPVPIIKDPDVGQYVRELWLNYGQRHTQQEEPNWEEAQRALNSLEPLGLMDGTVQTRYNQMMLSQTRALLANDKLNVALNIVQNQLKPPLPIDEIKDILLAFSRQKIEYRSWERADQVLAGLCQVIDDEDGLTTQIDLYHRWGDALLESEDFGKAINIYQRGKTKDFKPKIAHAYIRQANYHLVRNELAEAQDSYEKALKTQNTKAIRHEALTFLEPFLKEHWENQAWSKANGALKILLDLELTEEEGPVWQTGLQLSQAEAELVEGRLDAAFQRLGTLGKQAADETKTLLKTFVQQKARRNEWAAGAAVLKRWYNQMPQDQEVKAWRTNWLYLWAKALYAKDKLDKQPARAKVLCYKTLAFSVEEIAELDLLAGPDGISEEKLAPLRDSVCRLIAAISLDQAQACLDGENLSQAGILFNEVLGLAVFPDDIKQDILNRLKTFSNRQTLKERGEQARLALEMALNLEVGDRETIDALKNLPVSQARVLLKADQPEQAFTILKREKTKINDEDRETIKTMTYQFSRLYAGRNRWNEAKQALNELYEWLGLIDTEIFYWLDDLNRERLNFIRGRQLPIPVSENEIDRLTEEVLAAADGYRDARALELETQSIWVDDFIKAGLLLGAAHLSSNDLEGAIQTYQRILVIESDSIDHRRQISQDLHNYSERMLNQENWDEARLAMEKLRTFNLVAPDGRTRPDPRADGALQRVSLAQAGAWLKGNQIEKTFNSLNTLPRPRPTGEIKATIQDYSQSRRSQDDWENAIEALRRLDRFLSEDHPESRDQEALQWLVDGLEQWGRHMEATDSLTNSAGIYQEALDLSREAARPRTAELAPHFIRVAFRLAQDCLNNDPLTEDKPPIIDEATQWYERILNLPEHSHESERQINEALHDHAVKLAEVKQWSRGHEILDCLDILYSPIKKTYKTLFITWRRDLILIEVQSWLSEEQLGQAFARLNWLKEFQIKYYTPGVSWLDSEGMVKVLVFEDFCKHWLRDENWKLATQSLIELERLIPNDEEIITWEVEAFCQWGQAFQRKHLLVEAQRCYEQALEKAHNQEAIPLDQIENLLLEAQLLYAQREYLDQRDLYGAATIYKQVLEKPIGYLDRGEKICQALKNHSDLLTQQTPPDWEAAHQSLALLLDMCPDQDQVFAWRQTLSLQEMEARLELNEFDAVFDRLETLEEPLPLGDIQTIFHKYSQERAETEAWPLVIESFQRLGKAFNKNSEVRQWVAMELTALGELLESLENLAGGQTAFEAAVEFSQQ